MMDNIRDYFAEHPKVRIGLIIAVGIAIIVYIAYKMDESERNTIEQRSEQRETRNAKEVSFFGATETVNDIDEERANDLVETLNRRMSNKESELDAREERQRHEVEQVREELAGVLTELAALREEMNNPPPRENSDEVIENDQNQNDQAREYQLEGDERRLAARNQQYRRQQSEIVTESPQRTGNVIRTITQRSIREVTNSGEINETDIPQSRVVSERSLQKEGKEENQEQQRAREKREDIEFTLAMGSIISGTTLNGVAAPTSVGRNEEPIPVLMRIKHDAIMPSHFTLDLRECHILGSSVGDLASARVYIRAEGISCITKDGRAIEKNITAYAVSNRDGMAGIEGEVVTRSGEMLSNTMQAGFLSGFAEAASPQRVQPINTEPSTETLYQTQNLDRMAGAGMLTGASNALDEVAGYYMEMADAMWPVVEVLPGIQIDFIVQKGMTMKLGDVQGDEDDYYYD